MKINSPDSIWTDERGLFAQLYSISHQLNLIFILLGCQAADKHIPLV